MVGHWSCLTNLAQCPIEKWFILPYGWTIPIENLFVIKLEESHKNSNVHCLIESNNTTLLNLKTELFNNCLFSVLIQIIAIWKKICHYIFLVFYEKIQMSDVSIIKKISFLYTNHNDMEKYMFILLFLLLY